MFSWLILGCASNSGVVPIGEDTFMVSRQAATGFSGSGTLKADAIKEATQYCVERGKSLQVISTYEAEPPYILANFPKAEIQFMCLTEGDAELGRPQLKQQADSVIEIRKDANVNIDHSSSQDVYSELIRLDDLLKKGIITEKEFADLKAKLLSN